MKKLGLTGQRWLRAFHIFFACAWIGASLSLILMQIGLRATDGGELYGIDASMKYVDYYVIIPAAFGCLVTGFLISLLTKWGFFKFHWVTLKWVINVSAIIFGTFWLGPWLNGMAPISRAEGLSALTNPIYLHLKQMNTWCAMVQHFVLLIAVYISIFKPWGMRK
ncbi:MAG: hypothetical protein GTN81_17230 [Proteobacteria bacterium]|nr:hypothetical protein [Pseudomonadota bacterium]